MLPENIIFLAVSLNLFGHILYIKSVIKGHAKPNVVSWFIWMLAPFLGVYFQLKAGAGLSVLPIFMAGFGPLIILLAALLSKNSLWEIHTFDLFAGAIAIISLVIYIFTRSLSISIIFAIFADAMAFIPTLIKSWKFPESESSSAYSWAILSNIVGLLIIKDWSFTIYSFGIYLILFNTLEVIILYRKRIQRLLTSLNFI